MKYLISALIILLSFSPAIAGDYTLYIANDFSSPCAKRVLDMHERCKEEDKDKCRAEISWPINTAEEVSKSLIQYFNGEKTDILILGPAFSNAHFHFCGDAEVETVYQILLKLKRTGVKAHKDHVDDFIAKVKNLR